MKEKAMAGRPREPMDLSEKLLNDIIELYSDGGSDVEVKALIVKERGSLSNGLWNRWLTDEPKFSQTIKRGRLLSEAWWNENGRTNLSNKDFSYTGWYMNMKNRFGWADKVEQKNEVTVKEFSIKDVVKFKE